jgi:general secretion pathway protein D
MTERRRVPCFAPVLLGALLLAGCTPPPLVIPPPLPVPGGVREDTGVRVVQPDTTTRSTDILPTPKPAEPPRMRSGKEPSPTAPAGESANITLLLDQVPLASFIQVVYGEILKKNFTVDPEVASRSDLVTIRASQPQTPSQVETAARLLLKSYGVAVLDLGGGYVRIVPDKGIAGYSPEVLRGRALPTVPMPLRPIFQVVELRAVRPSDVGAWLKAMFGQKLTVEQDPNRNAVLLGGQSDDVNAALDVIQVLDQPLLKSQHSVRINPAFWAADEFARKLTEILQVQGYNVSNTPAPASVTLLPVQGINAIMVFATDPGTLDYVVNWARELDRPSENRGPGFFTYHVRHTDAQDLAKTIESVIVGTGQLQYTPSGAAPAGQPIAPTPATLQRRPNRVVVNSPTNTLIFQGNTEDYTSILNLLKELDRPAKAALIEVTVAEVRLDDSTQMGVEWAFTASGGAGYTFRGGTLGNLGVPANAGLVIKGFNTVGDLRLLLQFLATNNNARILSTPRVLARNGEAAKIQVGSEVPIITSQQTSPVTGGTGSIIQTVQYRNTGVILQVRPVIHSGDRVELEVAQEVSTAETTTTGVSSSPTFNTRRVETKLSVRDGATIMIGGLIQNSTTRVEAGVPLLKDIPVLGQAFRANTDTGQRTELLVLITPYILTNDDDALQITEAFRARLGPWAVAAPSPTPSKGQPPPAETESAQPPLTSPTPVTPARKETAPTPEGDSAPPATPAAPAAPAPESRAAPLPPAAPARSAVKPPAPAAPRPAPGATAPVFTTSDGKVVTDPNVLQELEEAMRRSEAMQQ